MGQYAVKLQDGPDAYYLHWSEIVDAPVFIARSLAEYQTYFRERFGSDSFKSWERSGKWGRLEAVGTSTEFYEDADAAIAFNRAGPGESELDREGILDLYCRSLPTGAR
jgi:hypothetical protein